LRVQHPGASNGGDSMNLRTEVAQVQVDEDGGMGLAFLNPTVSLIQVKSQGYDSSKPYVSTVVWIRPVPECLVRPDEVRSVLR